MLTRLTAQPAELHSAGASILAYLHREHIKHNRLCVALNMPDDRLSRMLNGKGRYAGERLTSGLVEAIADELDVPAAIRREWLSLLSGTPTQAA